MLKTLGLNETIKIERIDLGTDAIFCARCNAHVSSYIEISLLNEENSKVLFCIECLDHINLSSLLSYFELKKNNSNGD